MCCFYTNQSEVIREHLAMVRKKQQQQKTLRKEKRDTKALTTSIHPCSADPPG
jgi:Arc/MetJ-type ribon-helix-helix transcriptional regulator